MLGHHIHTAAMSITPDREALFNEVYETDHIPLLKTVPGVIEVRRYRRIEPPETFYLAVYEIASLEIPGSGPWLRARDLGRWPSEVRPFTSGLQNGVYTSRARTEGASTVDARSLYLLTARGSGSPAVERHIDLALEAMPLLPDVVAAVDYVDVVDGSHLLVAGSSTGASLVAVAALLREPGPAALESIETYGPV